MKWSKCLYNTNFAETFFTTEYVKDAQLKLAADWRKALVTEHDDAALFERKSLNYGFREKRKGQPHLTRRDETRCSGRYR